MAFVFVVAFVSWMIGIYLYFTKPVADFGGGYKEGMLGQPSYINPVLSQTSEVDSGLVQLMYSGIFKYDKNGSLVNDLAESYEISEDKKSYTVKLKQGVMWHDGEILTADDVVFTVNVINDPLYKSPLRKNWKGVGVEKIDDYTVKFTIDKPYFRFLNSLTISILPKHIWETISAERFLLTEYNLKPIGSGPYQFAGMQKDSSGYVVSYELKSFDEYFSGKPYISDFSFIFYDNEDVLIDAYRKKEINSINGISPNKMIEGEWGKNTNIYELNLSRYFAVFLNKNKSVPLANANVRKALAIGVDNKEIVRDVLYGKASCLNNPFLDDAKDCESPEYNSLFNLEEAKRILDEEGWKVGDDGIRIKDDVRLEFNLLTIDWTELSRTSEILKEQWGNLGVSVNVNTLGSSDLNQNYIRPREYDAILYGQATSFDSDPYFLWHSSQKKDPGINLSVFENEESDKILLESREELNGGKRRESYNRFKEILSQENPAVFLYTPKYLYVINKNIKGVELNNLNEIQHRFANASGWYTKTKRVLKNK
ncbi:ABC transporter substrate-binding protein [Patescibacteria group bacterium]